MKIAIMGSGGVGGYFGARLAAAGADVHFIARGAHLAALKKKGLRIASALGDLHLSKVRVAENAAAIGPADLVIIAVKLWDLEDAAEAVAPLIGPASFVVSFQNGVDSIERLAALIDRRAIIGGVAHIAAAIAEPGIIRHTGSMARLTIGEIDGRPSDRVEVFANAARKAGIDVQIAPDIMRSIWEKFVFLASFSGMTSLTRMAKGAIFADAELRALFVAAMNEVVAVARAKGVGLPADYATDVVSFAESLADDMKSSMLHDLEQGKRLELPWLSGAVVKFGHETDVPTPIHCFMNAALKLHALGRPQ